MSVNQPEPPRSLFERTSTILNALQLPGDDQLMRQRVQTFILCNGFHGVHRAAEVVGRHLTGHPGVIQNPWAYTVRVYNRNLARLSYLYTLTHWAENGLRSQLDTHYVMALGATWHRHPRQYLDSRQANSLQIEYAKQFTWQDQLNAPEKLVITPATPGEFLEHISLAWLSQMVLHVHGRNARSILVAIGQHKVDHLRAEALLRRAVTIRNAVAHNRLVSNEVFQKGEADLLALLGILQFDVVKALQNTEYERSAILRAARKKLAALP